MNGAEELTGALHKRRARCVGEFVADHDDAAGFDGRNIFPCWIAQCARWFGATAGGGPGQDDDVGFGALDFCVRYTCAGGDDHSAAGEFDELPDPGRGTDARIRPGLAIDARAFAGAGRTIGDAIETSLYLANQTLPCGFAI